MGQRFLFEDSIIKNLKYDGKRLDYFDKDPEDPKKGSRLCIRVGKRSKKWFIAYQINKKRKRYTLGTYPRMTLRQANRRVSEIMVDIGNGIDPAGQKQEYKASPTMNDLWLDYQKEPRYRQKSGTSQKEEDRKWSQDLKPYIGDVKVSDITRSKIKQVLSKKAKTAPVAANRLQSLLNGVFDTALDQDLIEVHPLHRMRRVGGTEAPRKRFLDDVEIKALWSHIEEIQPNPRDVLKLILLTCQRPGEVQKMRWSDIDFNKALWTVPDTKTGNDHLVPLSSQVLQLLHDRKAGKGYTKKQMWMTKEKFVFPTRYNTPVGSPAVSANNTKEAIYRLHKASGISGWTAHDLRRTGRTIMSRLQIDRHVRERVLGHAIQGVEGVYDQFDYLPQKKSALQKLADEIKRLAVP